MTIHLDVPDAAPAVQLPPASLSGGSSIPSPMQLAPLQSRGAGASPIV